MAWQAKVPNPKDEELIELKSKVEKLTDQLASMSLKVAEAAVKIEELTAELEIWRPTDKT